MRPPLGKLIIDLEKIQYNLRVLQSFLPKDTAIMPVVKADGYGLGAGALGHFYQDLGVPLMGVAHVQEARDLQKQSIHTPLLALQAHPVDFEVAARYGIHVSISQIPSQKLRVPLNAHIHVDTGMHRFGCSPNECFNLVSTLKKNSSIKLEGFCSHFSSAYLPSEDEFSRQQISIFSALIKEFKDDNITFPYIHLANSAGALRFSLPFCNLVRPGLMLYGIAPCKNPPISLKPALTLRSQIDAIHTLKKGDSVGYGRRYRAQQNGEKVAIIPLGYYDGISRFFTKDGAVLVRGKKAKVIGDICMDALMINVSDIPQVKEGDSVTFFGRDEEGKELPLISHSHMNRTTPYEVLTRMGSRVIRVPLSVTSSKGPLIQAASCSL